MKRDVFLIPTLKRHQPWYILLLGPFLLALGLYSPGLIYVNMLMHEVLRFENGLQQNPMSIDILALNWEKVYPGDENAAALWAQARWFSMHENNDGISKYQKALARDPQNPLIALELGNLYMAIGDSEQAQVLWQRAHSGRYWIYQAMMASEEANEIVTQEYIERAQQIAPTDPLVQLYAGDLLFKLGNMEQAMLAYSSFITGVSQQEARLPYALTQRARANYAVGGDWHLSERDLLTALELRPSDATIRIRLCELYRNLENLSAALTHCKVAVELAPRSAAAHYYLGRVLFAQRNFMAAGIEFETALHLDPQFISAQRWLERAREQE